LCIVLRARAVVYAGRSAAGCRQPQPDRKKLLDQFSECSKRANACGLFRLAAATAALAFLVDHPSIASVIGE
jgi:hypothetical protein